MQTNIVVGGDKESIVKYVGESPEQKEGS